MGTIDMLCVSLIVAMSMQCTFIAQFFASALAARGDMINLDDVSVLKEQFTPSAFSSLLLKELFQRSMKHRVDSESLTPIQQIPIVGTGCSFDLDVSLDLGLVVLPEQRSPVGEDPSLSLVHVPVFV